jgi:hypothetical protein
MKKTALYLALAASLLFSALAVSQPLTYTSYSSQTLLAAVTVTGAGTTRQPGFAYKNHTWNTVITGSPTTVSVTLEGSIDGTNWFVLDTSTSTSNEMRHVTNKPVTYLRANLGTLSGGSTPTVTVYSVSVAF